ncbi:MAG TPA: hypothetical protein VHA79_03835 [Mycobacteriales bacterium]|jgi:hypothetical protein|nr:hypothetical protein [Mycobacteriales bacterium]
MPDGDSRYAVPLDELLASHVPVNDTIETQPEGERPGPMGAERSLVAGY